MFILVANKIYNHFLDRLFFMTVKIREYMYMAPSLWT